MLVTEQLSYELLLLIGLPFLGYVGVPLKYDERQDQHRSFTREMLLRILKGFDSRRASATLSHLEYTVSNLSKDKRLLLEIQKSTDLRESLKAITNSSLVE